MPRPSWARYKITPLPSFAIRAMAPRNWSPQSHFNDARRSPVKHSEWSRVRTGEWRSGSPTIIARCSLPPSIGRKATSRHCCASISGTGASATFRRESAADVAKSELWAAVTLRNVSSSLSMSGGHIIGATTAEGKRRAIFVNCTAATSVLRGSRRSLLKGPRKGMAKSVLPSARVCTNPTSVFSSTWSNVTPVPVGLICNARARLSVNTNTALQLVLDLSIPQSQILARLSGLACSAANTNA